MGQPPFPDGTLAVTVLMVAAEGVAAPCLRRPLLPPGWSRLLLTADLLSVVPAAPALSP